MCVDVDMEDSSYLGFELKLGHSKALRSLRMCVYIYARFWSGSSERIIWLHRQALLQFSLAGVRAGVCLRIPLGQHWCVRLRPLKPGVLFKTPLPGSSSGSWLSTRERPPAAQHLMRRGALKPLNLTEEEFVHLEISLSNSHRVLVNCDEPSLSRGLEKNKHTHTHTQTHIFTHFFQLSALSTPLSQPAVWVPHSSPPLLPPPPHIPPLLPSPGLLASAPDF